MCDEWLSSTRSTGLSSDDLVCFWKCCRNVMKLSSVIHPDFVPAPILPTGAPLTKCLWYLTLGKVIIGGSAVPMALTTQATVTNSPLSPDVIFPICLTRSLSTAAVQWSHPSHPCYRSPQGGTCAASSLSSGLRRTLPPNVD